MPPPVPPQVVCVGGAVRDRKLRSAGPLVPGTSNPVRSERSFGGVARNVAENLARLGVATALVSLVGDDGEGRAIRAHLGRAGVDTRFVAVADGQATAEYLAVLPPSGELAFGLA
ncbi:MAG TPA: PfkB family carbohydrate kinase, partial [Microvirga sp.]|nr:PfkB family carbohydrate kinase [Microvirga sp.]